MQSERGLSKAGASMQVIEHLGGLLDDLVETLSAMIDCAAPDGEPIHRSRQLREFFGE
jgi:hypothetical protein